AVDLHPERQRAEGTQLPQHGRGVAGAAARPAAGRARIDQGVAPEVHGAQGEGAARPPAGGRPAARERVHRHAPTGPGSQPSARPWPLPAGATPRAAGLSAPPPPPSVTVPSPRTAPRAVTEPRPSSARARATAAEGPETSTTEIPARRNRCPT